jgi:cysteine desulfurase
MAYLDHAATTVMLDEAVEAYAAAAREVGNASSLHAAGRRARRTVEE